MGFGIGFGFGFGLEFGFGQSHSTSVQEQLKLDHAAVMAAKDRRENDSQQRHSEALVREREKRDRGVAVQNEHHSIALVNLRRKLDKEWRTITDDLQKKLGAVQLQVVKCELRQERGARHVQEKADAFSLQIMSLRNEVVVVACLQFMLEIFNFMICIFLPLFSLPLTRRRSIRWTNSSNRSETQIIKLNYKYVEGLT